MRRIMDFQKKSFKNPFFSRLKKNRPMMPKLIVLAGFLLLIALLYLLNSSSSFQIKNINISGNENISQDAISQVITGQMVKTRFLIFSQKSLIFFNTRAARNELLKKFYFESLKIKKHYFNSLSIEVKEEPYAAAIVSGNGKYYLDSDGRAIKKIEANDVTIQSGGADTQIIRPELAFGNLPVIVDSSNNQIAIGKSAIDKNLIDFIIKINNEIRLKADFNISRYEISAPAATEITAQTNEGWQLMLGLTDSASSQGDLINTILQQKVKDRKNLKYIDLRYEGKVFFQ